ncbi:hypothetical protein RH915_10395 [Serpentinicella sp. ANB-PHB4]|uniref:hypothetical protein n=1 Tax=Serpentinicella sp. ANB-PHB4 TaxID=3074076 RepID=UPI002854F05A|nr:hypothetical protein [Serpentinicella sp. ANB-PHB4]MDR5659898.1 hypothetical protein [Serpentinicella sp. ANB-PHB4]
MAKRKNMKWKVALTLVLTFMLAIGGVLPGASLEADAFHYTEAKMYPLHLLNSYETSVTYGLAPGTVMVMYPGSNRTVYTYSWAEYLVRTNQVGTVVMAGVGSSSTGTAAMAKQVANELGQPVAGIVSGWGDSTIWYYGPQGYYVGRPNNIDGTYYSNAASYKLYLLYRNGARPHRVVGHSKGSMDSANAFFRLRNEGRSWMLGQTTFISLGIGVNSPNGLANYRGYLGTEDSLGYDNTTNFNNLIMVNGSDHHLNDRYSQYLPLTSGMLAR